PAEGSRGHVSEGGCGRRRGSAARLQAARGQCRNDYEVGGAAAAVCGAGEQGDSVDVCKLGGSAENALRALREIATGCSTVRRAHRSGNPTRDRTTRILRRGARNPVAGQRPRRDRCDTARFRTDRGDGFESRSWRAYTCSLSAATSFSREG